MDNILSVSAPLFMNEFLWNFMLSRTQKNSVALVRDQTIPTERPPLVGEVSSNFADIGCHVVSVSDPYGRILVLLHRSRYFLFQAAPQLYSRGLVDSILEPLLLKEFDSAGTRTRDIWLCSQQLWPLHHRGDPMLITGKQKQMQCNLQHHVAGFTLWVIYQWC
jgi:hypothetical protein